MIKVTENLRKIQDLLRAEAIAAGRVPESVKLLAVSKRKPVEAILEAASAGQRDFGENFAQEGVDKIDGTGRDDLTWHFIGHLQSNKTRLVAERYDWVHTIDRIKIARRLSQQRPHHAGDLNVCIQVNIDDEPGKSGIRPEDAGAMASEIAVLPKLKLRGLMCIPAVQSGMDAQRKPF
ncbi:MAG: YggS family pyridoxal phosphate-dependent enzyme, partial [Woeseia sp.]